MQEIKPFFLCTSVEITGQFFVNLNNFPCHAAALRGKMIHFASNKSFSVKSPVLFPYKNSAARIAPSA